ncbi:Zn(2)-C6 fungal-type DNA-binding domain protein [Niveomyces insectorum RCEF 264]|uniref:Zn(2)-C6 fungal-type DNA-binding domain protein n=1 Tax=Niveomyces insectorum RCEF 264 TaxID=1081102 RepID=A0A167YP10_9HYPO|nr:Zn(2)-C6 fungal-type DNA-binding domain protein [Niveomyces insectorum RCEF 264]
MASFLPPPPLDEGDPGVVFVADGPGYNSYDGYTYTTNGNGNGNGNGNADEDEAGSTTFPGRRSGNIHTFTGNPNTYTGTYTGIGIDPSLGGPGPAAKAPAARQPASPAPDVSRKRHVKCDEAKPSCNRCLKWQGFCEGYSTAPADPMADTKPPSAAAAATAAEPPPPPLANTPPTSSSPGTDNKEWVSSASPSQDSSRRTTPVSDQPFAPRSPTLATDALFFDIPGTSVFALDGGGPVTKPERDGKRGQKRTHNIADGDPSLAAATHKTATRGLVLLKREQVHRDKDNNNININIINNNNENDYDNDDTVEEIGFGSCLESCSSSSFNRSAAFLLEPNFNSVMFSSQTEKMYFDSWLALAPNLGGGWFQSNLWTCTIPQLCRDEPAVRFAAIAIGALAQAVTPGLMGRSYARLLKGGTPTVPHYRNALTYYGHALQLLRLRTGQSPPSACSGGDVGAAAGTGAFAGAGAAVDGDDDPTTPEKERAAVLACLLFVCFEAMQGNQKGALWHITHGLQIVDQFVARNVPPRMLPRVVDPLPLPADGRGWNVGMRATTDIDTEVERQRQRQRQHQRQQWQQTDSAITPLPEQPLLEHHDADDERRRKASLATLMMRSPAPYALDDEVMQVFRRLDFQAWSLGVFRMRRTQPADVQFRALDALNPASIPAPFDPLDDARRWSAATAAGRLIDICDVPGAREVQRAYLECLERWRAAFAPLYDATRRDHQGRREAAAAAHIGGGGGAAGGEAMSSSSSSSSSPSPYLRAISLQVQYLLAWISVASLVYSDYFTMYQMTPQFRELNRLAAILLSKQPRLGAASSDNGDGNLPCLTTPGKQRVPPSASCDAFFSPSLSELFTMDNGPTMALFVIAVKCRVEAVRDEAIRLLKAHPRRDGFWDSKMLYAIASVNKQLEIDNEKYGTLEEQWVRLRKREAIFDETKPQAEVEAYFLNPETCQYEKSTRIVSWDGLITMPVS